MNTIKNIIFDLGGVIMNLDVSRTIKSLNEIGIEKIVNNTGHHYHHYFFYDFEEGIISDKKFLESLQKLATKNVSFLDIKGAWNAMILDIPEERINFLKNLKKKYNIFLLSNTNSIHQKKFISEFKENYGYSFLKLFDEAYFSHEIGFRKPNLEAYNFVIRESNLIPEETLFVDDSIVNVEAASRCNLKSLHVNNYDIFQISKELCKY